MVGAHRTPDLLYEYTNSASRVGSSASLLEQLGLCSPTRNGRSHDPPARSGRAHKIGALNGVDSICFPRADASWAMPTPLLRLEDAET